MNVVTFTGIVENGQIRLDSSVRLPDKATVYVVVPQIETSLTGRVFSPRLVHPEDALDFAKELTEDQQDARL
ncbi:MAG: hypothetical protein KDI03_15720 [Anaerolineae bacterium]|nr:hypothetical protein [Anaerolineae bacterium]